MLLLSNGYDIEAVVSVLSKDNVAEWKDNVVVEWKDVDGADCFAFQIMNLSRFTHKRRWGNPQASGKQA